MSVSLVYLTYLCQFTLDNNGDPGARAAAAGSVMLIIAQVSLKKKKNIRNQKQKISHTYIFYQFIWAICLTSPPGSWFSRDGTTHFKNSAVGVAGADLGRKFSNTIRPSRGNHHKKDYNSPLPPRGDEERDVGDNSSVEGDYEEATALHDCK